MRLLLRVMSSFSLCCLLLAACCLLGKRKKFLIQELRGQCKIGFLFTILLLVFVIIPCSPSGVPHRMVVLHRTSQHGKRA
jgi:hypothetical protein